LRATNLVCVYCNTVRTFLWTDSISQSTGVWGGSAWPYYPYTLRTFLNLHYDSSSKTSTLSRSCWGLPTDIYAPKVCHS